MRSCNVCYTNNHRALVKEINEEVIVVEGLRRGRPTLIIIIFNFSFLICCVFKTSSYVFSTVCTLSIVCHSLWI